MGFYFLYNKFQILSLRLSNWNKWSSQFANNWTKCKLLFTSTDTAGDWLTLSVTGSTENNYDWVYVTNGAGAVLLDPVSSMDYEVVSEDGT